MSLSYHLDSKLGAVFLGDLIAGIFYGVTTVQSLTYFRKTERDSILFRLVVFGLWLLDSVNVAFVTHALYFYLVTRYGDFAATLETRWSIIAPIFVNSVMLTLIRLHFARRIYHSRQIRIISLNWLASNDTQLYAVLDRNAFLFACTFVAALLSFSTGIAGGVRVFQWGIKDFTELHKINYLIYFTLSAGVAADLVIVGPLLLLAARNRIGLKPFSILNTLSQLFINTAIIAGLASAATLVTYSVWPTEYTFLGIYFTLSKLYFNSLLSNLNGRETIIEEFQEILTPPPPARTRRIRMSRKTPPTDESATAMNGDSHDASRHDSRFSDLSSNEPPRLEIRRIASEDALAIRQVLASQKEAAHAV